jgi:hypothetical protein
MCEFFALFNFLGHLQWADASRPRTSVLVRSDRRAGCARSSGVTHPNRRTGPPNLGHRCIGADRRAVRPCLSCGSRPRMVAT